MENYKKTFEENLNIFIKDLKRYVSTENGEWTIKGFIDTYKNIYTISSDTKIISKILEIHLFPELLRFADKFRYKIVLAEHQNWYPDLTFIHQDNKKIKFALDLKTTFRRNNTTTGFTLGSHGGYFKDRDKNKNIQFPYNEYIGHYCLGVIYSRSDSENNLIESEIYQIKELEEEYITFNKKDINDRNFVKLKDLKSITSVIKDFDFFVAPKWKIASDKQGSGNTANIGSITDIDDLKSGNGVFSKLGESWFDEYWINYGNLTMIKDGKTLKITNIWDFLEFKGRKDLFDLVVSKGAKKRK